MAFLTEEAWGKRVRKLLAVGSIIIGSVAVAIPDPTWSKVAATLATGMNAASLYMLKEENDNAKTTDQENTSPC